MARFGGAGGRARRAAAIAAVVVIGFGVGGCGGGGSDGSERSDEAASDDTVENPIPSTTALPTTTTAVSLPVPQPVPEDEYAPTPEVILGTIALPSIDVSQPLGEGITLTALDRSPGHWPGTAMPGQVGNVVVAGHRVTHTRPFYDLDLLQPGDPLVFTMADGSTHTYRLTGTQIVAADAMEIVNQTPAKTATLFACHPKHSAAQRIVASFALEEPTPAPAPPAPA